MNNRGRCVGTELGTAMIVSISQAQVRPIVRPKPDKAVEFGAKLDTSAAWINSIFLVMNLRALLRIFLGFVNRVLPGFYCHYGEPGRDYFAINRLIRVLPVF